MKGSDKAILLGVVMALVLAGFYMKVLSPKREEASSLKKDIADLQGQVDQQRQLADFAEAARHDFPTYYGRLVVLGKAVPADADTGSLLVELSSIAGRTGVKFNGLTLAAGSADSSSSATSTPAPSSGTSTTGTSTIPTATSTGGSTAPTAATEATAANLPLGASVGAAGLPAMPYNLTFEGGYFDIADFLKGVDDLVNLRGSVQVSADGRLLTIDGFSLTPTEGANPRDPSLSVTLAVTSYVTPSDQGLTLGATPGGPPSTTQPQAQPASATVTP